MLKPTYRKYFKNALQDCDLALATAFNSALFTRDSVTSKRHRNTRPMQASSATACKASLSFASVSMFSALQEKQKRPGTHKPCKRCLQRTHMAIEFLHTILHAVILLNVQLQVLQGRQLFLHLLTWRVPRRHFLYELSAGRSIVTFSGTVLCATAMRLMGFPRAAPPFPFLGLGFGLGFP